jgi:hypothetical protein
LSAPAEAAELLRAEAVRRTGLDGRPFFGQDPFPERIPRYSAMQVYDGDRLVNVEWARELSRLIIQIKDPGTRLPSSAWAQQQPMAYVASRYAVCYGVEVSGDRGLPMEPTEILALLPSSAEEALRGGSITPSEDFAEGYCSNVSTENARAAAESLREAGYASGQAAVATQPGPIHPLLFSTEVSAPTGRTLFVWFAPVLPHGKWKCLACG